MEPTHSLPGRPRESGWRAAVALFFLGWILIYANRTVLSPLLPVLEARWSLSREQLGLLTSAFFITYTAFQVPMGLLADRFRRKRVLVPGFVLQGLGGALSGAAPGVGAFLAARVVTGAAQASFYSANNALLMGALPLDRRALGTAVAFAGQPFGVVLGYLAAGWFAGPGPDGWRWPFVVLGGVTAGLGVAMGVWLREAAGAPRGGAAGAPRGGAGAVRGGAGSPARSGWARLNSLGDPQIWLYFFASFITMYGLFVLLPWLPYYLERGRGYTPEAARWLATLMPFISLPAVFFWSRLSDGRLGRRRVLLWLIPISGLALAGVVYLPGTFGLVAALAAYGLTGKSVMDPIIAAAVGGLTHPDTRATAFALGNFLATMAMVLAPWLTGRLADTTGGFAAGFYVAAAAQALAFGAIWLSEK